MEPCSHSHVPLPLPDNPVSHHVVNWLSLVVNHRFCTALPNGGGWINRGQRSYTMRVNEV